MSDIFISYARSTAPQAQAIAQALRALGYQVWRDDELPAHRAYAEVIEERLKAAKAVVVIWSAEAAKSEWVRSEADRARTDRKLVQLTVDGTALPMPFDQTQCADLSGWSGDVTAAGWRKIVSSIADLMGNASPATMPSAQSERAGVSICVLPFANMSNDPEQEYFADGISEDIITDLSKVSVLWVAARNTAFTFKGKHVDVPHVARQLKCSHVLEGSVRKSGNRVRITAQLIDGVSGGHVWAERYDRSLDDIFALQDEISEAIVKALKLKLLPEEKEAIEQRGTTNVEAYDLYLRAQAFVHQGGPGNVRACELFRAALALDPEFALAWAELAIAHANAQIFSPQDWATALKQIDEPVERALRLGPGLPASHIARGVQLVWHRDWQGAEQAFAKAVALSPSAESSASVAYGAFLSRVGRIPEAIEQYMSARHADPLAMSISANLQAQLTFAGRYAEAEAHYERSKDLAGDREAVEHMAFMRRSELPDKIRVKEQLDHFFRASSNSPATLVLRDISDVFDQPAAALEKLRRAAEDPTQQSDANRLICLAWWSAHYGGIDLALTTLRRVLVDMNSNRTVGLWFPVLREARKDPRFKAIVRDLRIADYWRKSGKWGEFARPVGDDDFEIIR